MSGATKWIVVAVAVVVGWFLLTGATNAPDDSTAAGDDSDESEDTSGGTSDMGLTQTDVNKLDGVDPALQSTIELVISDAASAGMQVVVASGHRDDAKQGQLYAHWLAVRSRTNDDGTANANYDPNALPASAPGTGAHSLTPAQAVDLNIVGCAPAAEHPTQYAALGALGKARGLTWGGDFSHPDPVHFETTGWRAIRDAQAAA